MKRRSLLKAAAGLSSLALFANPHLAKAQAAAASLRDKAQAKGFLFGCAVGSPLLQKDEAYAQAVARDAGILVHEYELKRKNVEPEEGKWTFKGADAVMAFAQKNNQLVRGHTLCWHIANPDWLEDALKRDEPRAEKAKTLTRYIETVMGRYGQRMHSWDVVNEPIEPEDWDFNDMRTTSPWYKAFGEDYIQMAFEAAKPPAGNALLFMNDYSVENDSRWNERRRTATLKLLERLKKKDVPIDGFGIQGHLKSYRERFSEEVFAKFLNELKGFDLKVMITELDMTDVDGPDDPAKRDADLAAVTKSFLDVSLASPTMLGVLTWGISDRYSWLSETDSYKRKDGTKSRVLPYDDGMKKKPMWDAIAQAFDAASPRA